MCTIVLAWRALADAPVAVAANRDEQLDRESLPPAVLDEDPQVVAPRDARAGGTWIGVSERGLLVAITNRWTEPPEDADDPAADDGDDSDASDASDDAADASEDADAADTRSRGLLVRDALSAPDAHAAVELVREAVAADRYAGFNLLIADPERATYLEWDGHEVLADESTPADALRERDLEPGVHAIVNPGLNDADDRAARLRAELAVQGAAPGAGAWLDAAAGRLRDHEYGVCVHGVLPSEARQGSSDERSESDGDGFGTRSSSLLAVEADGRAAYAFADGPPCETAYEQVAPAGAFLEGSF